MFCKDRTSLIFFTLFSSSVTSIQTGQVVAHSQHSNQDHWQLGGRPGEPDTGVGHHRLHLRCSGHAAIWKELPGLCL